MKQLFRFSVSGLLGFLITAALFVGMLSLLSGKQTQVKTQDTAISFSFVKDYEAPTVKPPKIKEKPVQEKVTQPPAIPAISVDAPEKPVLTLPENATKGNNFNVLNEIKFPGIGDASGFGNGASGGVKAAIAPMYPQAQLVKKTEGWVKLKINVNEFGLVSSATVIEAKPTRAFNAAAIKAVRKWKFHPKMVDGKAIPFQATQTIEFKLDQQ